jgi:hypothetical protein
MVQASVDLVTFAEMLGHSKINMVMRYAHPTEEHQFAAMEKMRRYMGKLDSHTLDTHSQA